MTPVTYEVAKERQREPAPLAHLRLPDDLLDDDDRKQAAIDADEGTNSVGIWQGRQPAS